MVHHQTAPLSRVLLPDLRFRGMELTRAHGVACNKHGREKPRQNFIEKITPMSEVDWQARYEAADTPWDKGVPHPMVERWAKKHPVDGAIIVPGCGRGWDLRAWAMAYPQHPVIGIDLAPAAVASARELCRNLPNVIVHQTDFFSLDSWYRQERISLIWEHTCFCAIPPSLRETYVTTVAKLLPSGAHLIGAFFTDIQDRDSGPPWNTPMTEIEERFSPWFVVTEPKMDHATFAGRWGEERSIEMYRR